MAFTRPPGPTVATRESRLVQSTLAVSMGWPVESLAVSLAVSPSAAKRSAAGWIEIEDRDSTVTTTPAATPPDVAVTSVLPGDMAVTRPSASTPATEGSALTHTTSGASIACPLASVTVAVTIAVSPGLRNVSDSGATATSAGSCRTVTTAAAAAEPALAESVATPFPAAVTRPDSSIAATEASLLDQAMATPAIT